MDITHIETAAEASSGAPYTETAVAFALMLWALAPFARLLI